MDTLKMYDVSNEPGKKNVYDLVGESGLDVCKKTLAEIRTRISDNPDENFLIFYILHGLGMIVDGSSALILNSFDEPTSFFEFWEIEDSIREIASALPNTY